MTTALLIFLLAAPVIAAIVWNGLHGKGYKFVYKAPPITTTKGKLVRVIAGVYFASMMLLLFASIYANHAIGGRYKGTSRIFFVIVFILLTTGFSSLVDRNRNK